MNAKPALALLAAVILTTGSGALYDRASGTAQQGGAITISQSSPPDYLDPALTYTVNGVEPLWLVYTPLITYKRAQGLEGTELIPGLATELPTISRDGRTYGLMLRQGLTYSDGAPVKASDFEHTIKRVLNLESGGSAFYLVIDGAPEYVNRGNAGADIPGIVTNDATGEITIELTEPDPSFSHVLAMWFAGLVPGDTPFRNMTATPPPGVGPYKVTSSVPGREFVLERNPLFDLPGIPGGKLDTITTRIIRSARAQARAVIAGRLDYMQDPPPARIKRRVKSRHSDRYDEHVTASTYYMFMNARVPPFDRAKVRRAVNYGIDKPALARLFAGELAPGCSFLPPSVPGYDRRLDRFGCPWGNPARRPNVRRARQLIGQADARRARVTVWGNNDDPTAKVTRAYARMLNAIGLQAKARIVPAGAYFQTVGRHRTRAQTGFANWFQDFPHPRNFMFLVDGRSIQPTSNQNFGNVDDPRINRAIARLEREPRLTRAVVRRWDALNRTLVMRGHLAPYGHRKVSTFMSERMDFDNCSLFHPVYYHDYSSFCLK
jgi:peptide/nickel transport system substrate-binding protein